MAPQTRCDVMNSEVAGSTLTVFPVKRKKGIFSCSKPCKTQPLKNNDESNTVISSHSNTEKFGDKIGYWVSRRGYGHNSENMSGLVGENMVENRV